MQSTIRINGYDDVEQLALGKTAAVFSARSRELKRAVLIHVLLPHLAAERRFVARFQRVVRTAVDVRHENIVNVLGAGGAENTFFVVTEPHEGLAVQQILVEHPRVPLPTALAIVYGVASGLEALHSVGIVHRDVRPDNVFIAGSGAVKLGNIGLATDLGENGRVTHAGRVTSTPAYMSPEQTRGEDLTPASDLFSLGAVAYELLCARRAFGAGDFGEIVERVQETTVPDVTSANPMAESSFARIVERLLKKSPDERYDHVSELVMDLEEAMDKYGHRAGSDELIRFSTDPSGAMHAYAVPELEKLAARPPSMTGTRPSSPDAARRYYRKALYLDPSDAGARAELEKLGPETSRPGRRAATQPRADDRPTFDDPALRHAGLDPNAQYRVILEGFDPARDNEASFVLKLSMKLRVPLPRAKAIVRRCPGVVAGTLPHRRAVALASTMEAIGGRVRLDVATGDATPENDATPRATNPAERSGGGVTCPSCGWQEETGAEFCGVCLARFESSPRGTTDGPRGATPGENPLAEPERGPGVFRLVVARFNALPLGARVIGGLLLLGLFSLLLR